MINKFSKQNKKFANTNYLFKDMHVLKNYLSYNKLKYVIKNFIFKIIFLKLLKLCLS